jgi:hypothetical protein
MKKLLILPTSDWLRPTPYRLHFIVKYLPVNYEIHVLRFSKSNNIIKTPISLQKFYGKNIFIHTMFLPSYMNEEVFFSTIFHKKISNFIVNMLEDFNIDYLLIANPIMLSKEYAKYSTVFFDMADYYPGFLARYLKFSINVFEQFLDKKMIKMINESVDVCVFSNIALKHFYEKYLLYKPQYVINNGYDAGIFDYSKLNNDYVERLKNYFGSKFSDFDNSLKLLFLGSFDYWVDPDILMNTFMQIKNKIDENVVLILAGKGPNLRVFMRKFNGFNRVIFTGFINYQIVPYFYVISNILIIPFADNLTSKLSFPLKALEALSLKRKILYSNVPLLKIFRNAYDIKQLYENKIDKEDLLIFDDSDTNFLRSFSWEYLARLYDKIISQF